MGCNKYKNRCSCRGKGHEDYRRPCGGIGLNKNVANQVVTTDSNTVLQLTNNPVGGFNNFHKSNGCCNPCDPCGNHHNHGSANILCIPKDGIYSITFFATVSVAPGSETVSVALDLNNQQDLVYPLTGSGINFSFSTNFNVCEGDTIKFRVWGSQGYAGSVTTGTVSVVRVSEHAGR